MSRRPPVGITARKALLERFKERSELDELLPSEPLIYEGQYDIVGEFKGEMFAFRDAETLRDETDRLALGGDPDDGF